MSGLNPNSQPFPAYTPTPISPPHTTSSPSVRSTWSSRSRDQIPTTDSSSPDSYPFTSEGTYRQKVSQPQPFPVKKFGSDWQTSISTAPTIKPSASMSTLTPPTTGAGNGYTQIRARSPSVPNIHTQLGLGSGPGHFEQPTIATAVTNPTRQRLQLPIQRPRPSTYDQINGHTYSNNSGHGHGHGLTHHSSAPDLMEEAGSNYSYDRRPSFHVPTWRAGIPEEPENEHDYESEYRSLSASKSVPVLGYSYVGLGGSMATDSFTQSRNIYISSVPAHISEDVLRDIAEQYGEILSIRLEKSPSFPPAESRAYVMFKDVNDAHAYYSYLKKTNIPCELAKEDYSVVYNSLEDKNSSNLYIQGFLSTDSMQFVESVIYPGVIVSSSRPKDSTGNVRGIVMARVQSRPQADEVIARLNAKWKHPHADQYLQVRIADSEAQKAFKKKHADPADGFKSPASMPNMRQGGSLYSNQMNNIRSHSQSQVNEAEWLGASRQSSFASFQTQSTIPPRTPTRTRLPSDISLHHRDSMKDLKWSSRVDHWSGPGSGEDSTPTSQFFGVGSGTDSQNEKIRHGTSSSTQNNLALAHIKNIWAQPQPQSSAAGY